MSQTYTAKSGRQYIWNKPTPPTSEDIAKIEAADASLGADSRRPSAPSPSNKPVTPGSPLVQAAGPLGMLMTPQGRETVTSALSSAWDWAKAHPAQAGAMVGSMAMAPFTGGASLGELMMLTGGGAAVGATGGKTAEKIATGQPWTMQDIPEIAQEGALGAVGAGLPVAAERAIVTPAARQLASASRPTIQATTQAATQRGAAAEFTNLLQKNVLPPSAQDIVGNQQELQSVLSETAPYVADYFKSRQDVLGRTLGQRITSKLKGGVEKSKTLTKDMVNAMADAYDQAIVKFENALADAVKTRGIADIKSDFDPVSRVLSDIESIKRTDAYGEAVDVLRRYRFLDANDLPRQMSYKELDQARKQLNVDMDKALSNMTSPDRSLAERSQADFRAMTKLARSIRDYEYEWLDSLGITDVAEMRMLESKFMDARRMFRSLTNKGESKVVVPPTPGQRTVAAAKVATPALIATAAGSPSLGVGVGGSLALAFRRQLTGEPGETTLNKALASAMKAYLPQAESAVFPSWEFGASVPRGYLPKEAATERVIVPPAPPDASGAIPFDYTAGAPSGTFTRQGYAVSEKATPLPRAKAPAPWASPSGEGRTSVELRELGAQTRVPGGPFEASPMTYGGRTAEGVLPETAEAGIRLGNIRGDYATMKQAYPDMPKPSANGRFTVTLPSGDKVKYSTKNQANAAQQWVDRFIREYGK